MRTRSITDEIVERAVAFIDRRAGAGIRRGGRSRGSAQKKDPLLYGIGNFSAANFFQSAIGGGEAGVDTGFGVVALAVWKEVPTGSQMLVQRVNGAVSAGWYLQTSGASLRAVFVSGAGVPVVSASYTIVASDLGRVIEIDASISGGMIWLIVNRQLVGAGVAITGYTPAASEDTVWSLWETTQAFTSGMLLSSATYRGNPSVAQRNAYADETRILGDLPSTMQGATITHRESVRDQLRGVVVTSGQTAPAQLDDTITRAAADALARQGSPTVVTIDTSRDGRRTLGVQGFSPTTYLSVDGGLVGSDAGGLRVTASVRVDAVPSGNQMIQHRFTNTGWYLSAIGAVVRFTLNNNAVLTQSAAYTITSADVGKMRVFAGQYDGAGVTLYADGVATGAPVAKAMTPALVPSTGPMQVGQFSGAQGLTSLTVWGIEGGLPASAAEIRDQALAIQAAGGRVQSIAGKTQIIDDFHAAILAAGETVPAQLAVMTRVGGLRVTSTPANGIADISSAHWIQSAGVTLPGAASGFYAEVLGYYVAGASAEDWFSCAAFAATAGWRIGSWNGYANIQAGDGSAAKGAQGNTLLPAGLNHLALVYDGSSLKQFLNGTLYNTTATFTYALGTLPANFGVNRPSAPVNITTKSGLLGGAYGLIAPSDAQIAAAASAALSGGRIVGVPGHSQRYDLVQDVLDAGGKVPAIWRERVSNVNTMVTVGAPLQVAQRTERIWSYETSPIYYGASAFTDADRFVFDGGFPGDAASWWGLLWYIVTSQSVPSATRGLLGCNTASSGWDVRTTLTNTTIQMGFADGAGSYTAVGTAAIAAADVGKVQAFGFGWNAPAGQPQTFAKRAAIAAAARTGYTPSAGGTPLVLGGFSTAGNAATAGISILGFALGFGAPALAEWQAAFDAGLALERVVGIANRTSTLVDLTLDAKANGGALAALAQDRAGGGRAMTRAGSPTITAHHARAFGW